MTQRAKTDGPTRRPSALDGIPEITEVVVSPERMKAMDYGVAQNIQLQQLVEDLRKQNGELREVVKITELESEHKDTVIRRLESEIQSAKIERDLAVTHCVAYETIFGQVARLANEFKPPVAPVVMTKSLAEKLQEANEPGEPEAEEPAAEEEAEEEEEPAKTTATVTIPPRDGAAFGQGGGNVGVSGGASRPGDTMKSSHPGGGNSGRALP